MSTFANTVILEVESILESSLEVSERMIKQAMIEAYGVSAIEEARAFEESVLYINDDCCALANFGSALLTEEQISKIQELAKGFFENTDIECILWDIFANELCPDYENALINALDKCVQD